MYNGEQTNQMILDILANLGDQGKISEILNDFRADYTTTLTDVETLNTEKTELGTLNENLRGVNNKMMKQLGDLSFLTDNQNKNQNQNQNQNDNEVPYSSLYNENGELK